MKSFMLKLGIVSPIILSNLFFIIFLLHTPGGYSNLEIYIFLLPLNMLFLWLLFKDSIFAILAHLLYGLFLIVGTSLGFIFLYRLIESIINGFVDSKIVVYTASSVLLSIFCIVSFFAWRVQQTGNQKTAVKMIKRDIKRNVFELLGILLSFIVAGFFFVVGVIMSKRFSLPELPAVEFFGKFWLYGLISFSVLGTGTLVLLENLAYKTSLISNRIQDDEGFAAFFDAYFQNSAFLCGGILGALGMSAIPWLLGWLLQIDLRFMMILFALGGFGTGRNTFTLRRKNPAASRELLFIGLFCMGGMLLGWLLGYPTGSENVQIILSIAGGVAGILGVMKIANV